MARGPSLTSLGGLGESGAFVQEFKSYAGGSATGDILGVSQQWYQDTWPMQMCPTALSGQCDAYLIC